MSDAPGILINRDPPLGTGWCGTEDCKHPSHKFYNEPAKAVKPDAEPIETVEAV